MNGAPELNARLSIEEEQQRRYDAEVEAARAKMGRCGGWYLGAGLWQLPDMSVVRVDGGDAPREL